MAKLFLSYRHESDLKHPDHKLRVKELGEVLRKAEIEVVLDQFYAETNPGGPDEQWPAWCEHQVPEAERVLMLASDGYFHCYEKKHRPGTGLGAACETTVIRNTLYDCGYVSEKFRIGFFDKTHLSAMPAALRGIHRFDLSNPDDIESLIRWVKESDKSTTERKTTIWPASLLNHEPDIANRSEEFAFFRGMIAGATTERAMLLKAPGNQGKTTLLKEFRNYALQVLTGSQCVVVDFKDNPSKEFVLDTLRKKLGGMLPSFCKPGSAPLDLRTDLQSLTTPVLLLFDTYEKASAEAKELIVGQLLPDLEDCSAVRIVIAGQTVPDHNSTFWGTLARHFFLDNISDALAWCSFFERKFGSSKGVSQHDIEFLTMAADGNPGVIRPMLQTVADRLPTK